MVPAAASSTVGVTAGLACLALRTGWEMGKEGGSILRGGCRIPVLGPAWESWAEAASDGNGAAAAAAAEPLLLPWGEVPELKAELLPEEG